MIYFIQQGKDGPVKIGYTNGDPDDRLDSLQTGNPYQLEVIRTIEGGTDLERKLHARCKDKRLCGEWFDITQKDVDILLEYLQVERLRKDMAGPSDEMDCSTARYDGIVRHKRRFSRFGRSYVDVFTQDYV